MPSQSNETASSTAVKTTQRLCLSYSHDSREHQDRVRELADVFVSAPEEGIPVVEIDGYYEGKKMKRFVLLLFLIISPTCIVSQTGTPRNTIIPEKELIQPGVVVEEVSRNSAAEKAGLQEGDTLLVWRRGDATGYIDSPFDFDHLAIGQGPQGTVSVKGVRKSEESTWTLAAGFWGLKTRPRLPENLLSPYLEGRKLAQAGKWIEAAEEWRTIANQISDPNPNVNRLWLLSKVADGLAQGHEWTRADEVYQLTLQGTEGSLSPASRCFLLRAWANTYRQRSDWANAEKYYQQALAETQETESKSLMVASILDDLGTISTARGDLTKAEEHLRPALDVREELAPGSLEVAASLTHLGIVASQRGNLAKAEAYLRQGLATREKMVPGSLEVAESFHYLGGISGQRGDLAKAEEYFHKALDIKEKLAPGSRDVAATVIDLGNVAYYRGDLAKAEQYYRRSLDIEQKLAPGSLGVANALDSLGAVAEQRGDLAKAEEYYQQGLDIRNKLAPGSLDLASSLNSLGNVARQRSELTKADQYFHQALDINQTQAPGSLDVGTILNNLGIVARKRGELAQAQEYYRQALDIRQKLAAGSMDLAITLIDLATVESQQGEPAKAEERYLQALDISKKLAPGSLYIASIFDALGTLAEQRGDLAKAEEYLHQAFEIREKLAPGSLDLAWSLYNLGNVASMGDDMVRAEEHHRQALDIREKLAPQSEEYSDSLVALAKVLQREKQIEQAALLYRRAVDVLEKQMAIFGGSEESRSGFRTSHLEVYRASLDLSVQQGHPESAFHLLERSRAQGLLETLLAAHVDIRQGVDQRLIERERTLRQLLIEKSSRIQSLNNKSGEAESAALDKEIQEILSQYQEVEGQIRQASPGYAALTHPQSLSVKEVQQELLDNDTLLLEYALGEERSYVFAVTQDSLAVFPLAKRADIDASAKDLYLLLADRGAKNEAITKQATSTLSHQVLDAVAGQLNKKRLVVVSDGALQYIPFTILPTPGNPSVSLLANHEVVNLPSASVLAVLRWQLSARKIAPKSVAILADPVFDRSDDRLRLAVKDSSSGARDSSQRNSQSWLDRSAREAGFDRGGSFPRLLFSRREANAIYSTARGGDATELLDFDASKDAVMNSRLRDYRVVHFATHGLLNSQHPEMSGLVFSLVDRYGNAQDGFLRLIDVYNLELNADLVVLSACQTGLGKQIAGEGLVGLTRGFMYAGTPRVIASLWKVDDEATAELMKKLYESMLKNGLPPAQALRSSQIWMSQQKRWRAPYYWAGFVLQGEWK